MLAEMINLQTSSLSIMDSKLLFVNKMLKILSMKLDVIGLLPRSLLITKFSQLCQYMTVAIIVHKCAAVGGGGNMCTVCPALHDGKPDQTAVPQVAISGPFSEVDK